MRQIDVFVWFYFFFPPLPGLTRDLLRDGVLQGEFLRAPEFVFGGSAGDFLPSAAAQPVPDAFFVLENDHPRVVGPPEAGAKYRRHDSGEDSSSVDGTLDEEVD